MTDFGTRMWWCRSPERSWCCLLCKRSSISLMY